MEDVMVPSIHRTIDINTVKQQQAPFIKASMWLL
jgi:hypothetical protein